MTVVAVLGGVGALVIVVLAYAVGRLRSDVRRLSAQVVDLESRPVAAATETAVAHQSAVAGVVAPALAHPDDGIPVITAMPETQDELDLTTARVASITLARPLIKLAAFSYGLRSALDDEHRFRIRFAMRQELKRQRKMRRRRRSGQAPSMGWRR